MIKFRFLMVSAILIQGCTFQIELTSQRTALENQIIGTQKKINSDLVLISSVRALDNEGEVKTNKFSPDHEKALQANQNRQFNNDDLIELKNSTIIGESDNGLIAILPKGILKNENPKLVQLAEIIVAEENRDRETIWWRMIQMNPELNPKDIEAVRNTFAKQNIELAFPGHWLNINGKWIQKN